MLSSSLNLSQKLEIPNKKKVRARKVSLKCMKAHGIIIVINNRCQRIENSMKFELLKSFHYSSISPSVTISVVNNRAGNCLTPWINKYRALTLKLNGEVGIFSRGSPPSSHSFQVNERFGWSWSRPLP